MKKISIGIDFSKKTFDATVMRRDDDSFIEVGYEKFNNDEKGFREFISWVRKSVKKFPEGKGRSSWIFCGENTGVCSAALSDFLAQKGYDMWLENALVIHRKSGIVRTKDDRTDSLRIAEYALRNYGSDVRLHTSDSKDYKRLRSLYAAHRMLVRDKVSKSNQIKSGILDNCPEALALARQQLESIEKQVKQIDAEIVHMLKTSPEFSHSYEIMNSFNGVGPITIACIIVKTHNFRYMSDARVFGNYIGVVPSHKEQSGTSIDRKSRLSKYRDRDGNASLSQVASVAIRTNQVIKEYYLRLLGRGVMACKAKNNCKFKILNILFAMIRNDTEFDIEKYGKSKARWNTAV